MLLAVAACGDSQVGDERSATTTDTSEIGESARPPARSPVARPLVVQSPDGTTSVIDVIDVDGRTLFEGDIEVPRSSSTRGAAVSGKRWYARTIPYVVDAALPYKSRVTDAIAHWESLTSMRFVPRTTEADYVRFTPGRGCSSPMGRVGSAQDVVLQAGVRITSMVGADFSPSTNRAHFWFKDGTRSVGRSSNIDEYEILSEYTLPAGKAGTDVIDMAFAPSGNVYTWYRDGTYSIGTASSLGSVQGPQPFALPAGRKLSTGNLAGLAFSSNGRVHAWYDDGTKSEGTAQNLGAYVSAQAFALPAGESAANLLALGIANGGTVYSWYSGGKATGGTTTSLGATYAPYAVSTPGHCGVPQVVHEIGHAVGLWHEQTRLDRDQYINIWWSNITAANVYNFNLRTEGGELGPYDFASIMHYDSYAFSSNGRVTMSKKDGTLIESASVLSAGDISGVASLYP